MAEAAAIAVYRLSAYHCQAALGTAIYFFCVLLMSIKQASPCMLLSQVTIIGPDGRPLRNVQLNQANK